jgi:hypothetical protein
MDAFEEYEASNPLSKEVLLSEIDEYEMYKHYMGFYPELRTGYNSPLRRGDESPSFSLFTNQYPPCEYRWKDSGIGVHGDIFKLVRMLYGLTTDKDIIKQIRQDLSKEDYGLHNPKIVLKERPKDKGSTDIKVKSKEWSEEALRWWNSYSVSLSTLQRYHVSEVEWFSMNNKIIHPKGLCFAYREMDKYQIYQPHNPDFKFRNNFDEKIVMGFHQLQYQKPILIITKSKKDIMVLEEIGLTENVAARSENTVIPSKFLDYFDTKYQKKFELFDNDGKHKGEIYWDKKIFVPLESGAKDISDFVKMWGIDKGRELIKQLIS